MGVERIRDGDSLIAIIVRGNAALSGRNFFSEDDDPLQFGVNFYEMGAESKPHIHIEHETVVTQSQEMLHIDSGKLELSLFSEDGRPLGVSILNGGDSVFLVKGGHGIRMIEPTKIIEVKQGPYYGVGTDKRFI